MNILPPLTVTENDVKLVRKLADERVDDSFVRERIQENVLGKAPLFDRETFWYVLLGCLLTTRQRSTTGSPVHRFLSLRDFPLRLELCHENIERTVRETLAAFGGIRMAPTVAERADRNYRWLKSGGWTLVHGWFESLAKQRNRPPRKGDSALERHVAHASASPVLRGLGPKQSRNLWQWLGLTRYETPLDSRVASWINRNLSVRLEVPKLGDDRYYDTFMDYLQDLCRQAGVLPCVLDAAAFDDSNSLRAKGAGLAHNSACVGKTA